MVNINTKRVFDVPLAGTSTPRRQAISESGVYAMAANPSRTLHATGGLFPGEIGVYSLPTLEPLAVLKHHTDWIFSCTWLDDTTLLSGSRDQSLALWSLGDLAPTNTTTPFSQDLPSMARISVITQPNCCSAKPTGKVRAVTNIKGHSTCASLTPGGSVELWDSATLRPVSTTTTTFTQRKPQPLTSDLDPADINCETLQC